MMERINNYFGGDPDADRGPFLDPGSLGGMEDFKQSFRNMVAMNDPEALREFIRASMEDMMTIAQDDPAFAAEFYKAANMFPETMEMLPPNLRTPDMDEVRGNMGPVIDAMEAAGAGASLPAPVAPMPMERGFQESLIDPGYGMAPMMGMAPDLPNTGVTNFGPQFRPGENNGPFDRDLSAGTEGGYGREPMPMEYASGGYVNKPMEYAYGGYVNKPRAMGHGGYVQGQGSSMDMAEKENVRPVNRTLSTALSPTLSIKLFG